MLRPAAAPMPAIGDRPGGARTSNTRPPRTSSRWNRGGCSRRSPSRTRWMTGTTTIPSRTPSAGPSIAPTRPPPAPTTSSSRSPRRPRRPRRPGHRLRSRHPDLDDHPGRCTAHRSRRPVDIDGFTEANVGVPYPYPDRSLRDSPTEITSVPNTTAAIDGNNAQSPRDHRRQRFERRDGLRPRRLALDAPGTDHRRLRRGRLDPQRRPTSATRSRGISSGRISLYPVDPNTGAPLPSPERRGARGRRAMRSRASSSTGPTRRWAGHRPRTTTSSPGTGRRASGSSPTRWAPRCWATRSA